MNRLYEQAINIEWLNVKLVLWRRLSYNITKRQTNFFVAFRGYRLSDTWWRTCPFPAKLTPDNGITKWVSYSGYLMLCRQMTVFWCTKKNVSQKTYASDKNGNGCMKPTEIDAFFTLIPYYPTLHMTVVIKFGLKSLSAKVWSRKVRSMNNTVLESPRHSRRLFAVRRPRKSSKAREYSCLRL